MARGQEFTNPIQDSTVVHLFQPFNACIDKPVKVHPCSRLHNGFLYGKTVVEEKPHIVYIAAGLANPLVHGYQFMGKVEYIGTRSAFGSVKRGDDGKRNNLYEPMWQVKPFHFVEWQCLSK